MWIGRNWPSMKFSDGILLSQLRTFVVPERWEFFCGGFVDIVFSGRTWVHRIGVCVEIIV
jgi:hypothetical protein